MNQEALKRAFKGFIIESGNAYTMIYKDETGILRILQVWWEEGTEQRKYELESVNLESEEIADFIKAIEEVSHR